MQAREEMQSKVSINKARCVVVNKYVGKKMCKAKEQSKNKISKHKYAGNQSKVLQANKNKAKVKI